MEKNKKIKSDIRVNGKRYEYFLEKKKKGIIHMECKSAKINQEFLTEDIAGVLMNLPNLILAEKKYSKKEEVIQFRVSPEVKKKIEKKALKEGFDSVSSYARNLFSSI